MLDSRFGWVLRAARENPMRVEALGFSPHPYRLAAFPTLTVEENLVATASNRSATWGDPASRWTLDRVWTLFPHLRARRRNLGDRLSGGEQQMPAIGRALMTNPGLLLLDEAMDGLAPVIRAEIWAVLAALKAEGQSILLIDKSLSAVLRLADRVAAIEKGRTVWTGTSAELTATPAVRDACLGV